MTPPPGTRSAAWLDRAAALLASAAELLGGRGRKLPLAELGNPAARAGNERRVRARTVSVGLGDGLALCRVLGRYKFYVQGDDFGLAVHLMLDGFWEMWLTQVLIRAVRPGGVVADVGANQGYFTVLLADLVGPEGRVLAFEPNPRMTAMVRRSVHANGFDARVRVLEAPAGAGGPERVLLTVPDGQPSGAYLAPGTVEGAVPTVSLDQVVGDGSLDLVKIDAEGWELEVWRGMRGILARGAPLVVVMEFVVNRRPGAAEFLAEVAAQGFASFHCDPRRGPRPVGAEEILAAPTDREWLLLLRR